MKVSQIQILEVSELSGQSIRTLPPIPTCKNRKPTPGAGWFLHEMERYMYAYIYDMHFHIDTCYISYLKMIILSCPENHDFAISIRFTGSPFVVFFVVGNDNVTYKNKCKNLPHKTILKGLLIIHTHTTISKNKYIKMITWAIFVSFTTGESPLRFLAIYDAQPYLGTNGRSVFFLGCCSWHSGLSGNLGPRYRRHIFLLQFWCLRNAQNHQFQHPTKHHWSHFHVEDSPI